MDMEEASADRGHFEWVAGWSQLAPLLAPEALGVEADSNVVDIGCGNSTLPLHLSSLFTKVTGLDREAHCTASMKARHSTAHASVGWITCDVCDASALEEAGVLQGQANVVVDKGMLDCAIVEQDAARLLHAVRTWLLAPNGVYVVISFRRAELLVPILSCPELGWDVTHTSLSLAEGEKPASVCTMRSRRSDASGETLQSGGAVVTPDAPEVAAVASHVQAIVDQWYRDEAPLLTAEREQQLRVDWAAAVAEATPGGPSDGALPLRAAWHVMLTPDERGELPLDEFAEDAAAFMELSALESQTELPVTTESKGGTTVQHRSAVINTIWSFVATFVFAFAVVLPYKGKQGTIDFITGFLVEKSLSVDNLFVFLMLFEYFKVPDQYTERVLRWGIMSALVLRGVMIAVGVAAVQRFRPVLLGFALILIVSAYKMLQHGDDDEDLQDNAVMKIARRLVSATDEYDGDKFFTKVDGVRRATPMLVVLICIELSDVLFAVDSIPAVVGITQDAFIVYSSNIFALMALRSLYLILSKSVQQLVYLRHSVATILGFVGVKMVLEFFHVHVSSFASLAVICGLLAAGTIASMVHNRRALAEGKKLLEEHVSPNKSVDVV